jgi:hypothetical protein
MRQRRKNPIGLIVTATLLVVLLIGIGLGLLLSQVLWPPNGSGASIASLSSQDKDRFALLVSSAYVQDHDLQKAEEQLDQLGVPNVKQWVADLAERYVEEGESQEDIQALSALADGLGVASRDLAVILPTPTSTTAQVATIAVTPAPTDTLTPSRTPIPPTDTLTPSQPTDTLTPVPPTDTDTPAPTATSTPTTKPSDTPRPPTNTPRPRPTNTSKPPAPTKTPAPQWSYTARLIGPNEPPQGCNTGNLQIRVMVLSAAGDQIPGVWIYDVYSKLYQVTGNVGSPDWGPGETRFEYGGGGGGRLCITAGQGGDCVSGYTRDMPCYYTPPVEDMFASGYCDKCCDVGISLEGCRQRIAEHTCFETGAGHYSWQVVFRRGW